MGHNYAKPLTSQVRMERVLSRLPEDWSVRIEREPGKGWRAWMQSPTHSGQWSEPHNDLADALEEVWRAVRGGLESRVVNQHGEHTVDQGIDQKLDCQQQDHRREVHAACAGKDIPNRGQNRFDDAREGVEERVEKPVTNIQHAKAQQHGQNTVSQKSPYECLNDHQDNGVQGKHAENLVGKRGRPGKWPARNRFCICLGETGQPHPDCLTETGPMGTIKSAMGL